MDVHKLIDITN